jgi:hypothetical protein
MVVDLPLDEFVFIKMFFTDRAFLNFILIKHGYAFGDRLISDNSDEENKEEKNDGKNCDSHTLLLETQ